MFKRRSAKRPAVVGLDLDPSHIAAAEVHVNGALTVTRGAVAPLRPGVLRDGEVTDPAALAGALRSFFAQHELPTRVRLGVAHQRIVVRTIDLPPLEDPKALDAAVRATAPDHLPMPMEEAILDHQPLGLVATPAGERLRVVVVAVRREMIERLVAVTRDAGLALEGIDLAAFGMVRALAGQADGAVLYLSVAGLTNVAVARGTDCVFTRATGAGLQGLVTTLAERRSLTLEHAAQWLAHVGLAAPLEAIEGDPELVAAVRETLEEGVGEIADSVRNSLNFYRTQDAAGDVERAVLCGPAVGIAGFAERLGELLSLPVEPATVALHEDAASADGGELAVAAGLAVETRA